MFNFLMRVEPINKIETINMVQSFMFAMSQVKDPEQFAWWYDIFMSSIGWILFPRGPLTAAGLIKSISPSQYFTGGCPLQLLAIIGHIFVKFISNIDYRPIIFKDIENLEV
ncbi:MAG: hypothetical protein EZS28_018815 [Streblomastix strix]|uniref:Uncharacterized protein n=1 Tax=Streblomastix strix TaxID=222440 RepID=A0A5J4VSR8_9EUKA|nr:MAG: hypothetical protein EZS28_018815 [Streblomastix strix]